MTIKEPVYKKIDKIVFGLFSPKQIKKMASMKVVTAELYDKEGYPVDGGLMDVRMGVIDPGLRCKTCGSKLKECVGHFGYMELARPIVHIKYIPTLLQILRASCRSCGRVLVTDEKIKDMISKNKTAPELLKKLKTTMKCPHCEAKQYSIKIEKPTSFLENDKRISPIEVRSRLEKIPDDDLRIFGLNPEAARPEWMVITVLPVPPVTARPSITLESGERSEDDLTHKLSDIVRINQRLFENINAGAPEIIIEDLWDLLQYHITTYIDNGISNVPPARHRSGQPLKTITERIKSKEGRFRHNLAGKRVNYSARTVISPDPRIKFNEVGVPKVIAMDLTIPEKVTDWNIKRLKKFVERGPENYPGANYVIRPDGAKKKITQETQESLLEELENGFIVERHLIDGDISIFNRQPSLHRMSIMCHKIKVLPGKSFRLNPAVCTPYAADFDGDEMNLHIPQTEEARAEAEMLMPVQTQLISPKNGLNIIGCIEDSITGIYLLTKGMELPREEAISILYSIGIKDFSKLKKSTVSGKDVFSSVLPNDFDFIGNSKACQKCQTCKGEKCPDDAYVSVKKGILVSGVIDKNTIGEEKGILVRSLFAQYSPDKGITLLGRMFKLGVEILLRKGFTTAISDTDLPDSTIKKIDSLIDATQIKIKEMIVHFKKGKLEAMPGLTEKDTLEGMILRDLNKLRDKIGELVLETTTFEKNPTIMMARAGAKGNFLNLAQMAAMVGQQASGGNRIGDGYAGRTLSIFQKGDLSPLARGFVEKGYKSGLNPAEFFFHSMTGRESLMDTALRTPKSGYLYRRLANALQDLKIEYDGTVRDANKKIVQFKYGEDGVDVSKSEGGIINVKRIVKEVIHND